MRKFLFLLLALTMAVGASAGEDLTRDQRHATSQEARQALIERAQQHTQAQKAQPQHQSLRERLTQYESKGQTRPEFKVPGKSAAEQPKAVIPAKRQAEPKAAQPQTTRSHDKPIREPQVSEPAKAKAVDITKKDLHNSVHKTTVTRKAPNRTPELITDQPAGRMINYDHTVTYYDFYYGGVYDEAAAQTTIIYDPDGETVYLKNIFFEDNDDSWVRGTISGNKIHVPLGQYILYDDNANYGFYLTWGSTILDQSNKLTFVEDPNVTEFTLTINGDNLVMDNTRIGTNGNGATGLAEIADDNGEVPYLQCSSTLSDPSNVLNPVGYTVISSRPAGQQVVYDQTLSIYVTDENVVENQSTKTNIVFAPDGETVYFNRLFYYDNFYNSTNKWVKGTIEGNKIHVPLPQFTTMSGSSYTAMVWGQSVMRNDGSYFFAWDADMTEMTYTIDRKGVLTLDNASPGVNGVGVTGFTLYNDYPQVYLQFASVLTPPYKVPELITDLPEGQREIYMRTSEGLINTENGLDLLSGNDRTKIVYASDGVTVYIQNPVAAFPEGTWVKGTISGNTITVPMYQYIYYNQQDSTGGYLAWGTSVKNPDGTYTITPDYDVTQITYTINGDNITLNNSNGGVEGDGATGLVVVHDDGDVPVGMEWNTEYTHFEIPELITDQPEGTLVDYKFSCPYYYFEDNSLHPQQGRSRIVYCDDNETVYIQLTAGELWMRGTISGNKITVPLGQYLWYETDEDGDFLDGEILLWGSAVAAPMSKANLVFNQDASVTEATFTINGDVISLDNSSSGGDEYLGATGLAYITDDGSHCFGLMFDLVFSPYVVPTVITEQPEGTLKTYNYSGYAIASDGNIYPETSSVDIVFAPDGQTVYFKDIMLNSGFGTWVRGTISDGKIHVLMGQYIYFDNDHGYGFMLGWGQPYLNDGDELMLNYLSNVTEATFTINGNTITLDNSSFGPDNGSVGATGLAIVVDVEPDYFWQCDVLTKFFIIEVIDEQPEGELVTYQRSGYFVSDGSISNQEGTVDIVYAPDGETVYIRDIIYYDNLDTWVRGTISDGKLHVPLGQYILRGNGYNFFIGWGQSYLDGNNQWKLNYDPTVTEATYTIDGNTITLDNSSFGPDDGPDGATGLVMVVDVEPDYLFQCEVFTQFYIPTAITEKPEGELVQYVRHGSCMSNYGQTESVEGLMEIVYAPDGETVYIKDPISYSINGTWVRGTLEDDIITVPLGQYLSTEGKYYTLLAWGTMTYNQSTWHYDFTPLNDKTEIQYIFDNDTIYMMDGWYSGSAYYGPAAMQDDGTHYAQGVEYEAYYTPYDGPTVIIDQPEGNLVTYQRIGSGFYYEYNPPVDKKGNRSLYAPRIRAQEGEAKVVFAPDGQTVYLKDPVFCNEYYNRGTWVQGTLSDNGTKIHVPLGQYVYWDIYDETGETLAWGSTSLQDEDGNQYLTFTTDPNATEVTYTIANGCIYLDNSSGGDYQEYTTLYDQYYNGEIDEATLEQLIAPMLATTGLAYVDGEGNCTGECSWSTVYVGKHPATLTDPVIYSWSDYNNENGNSRLDVEVPTVDTEGLPIFVEAMSYSIYTDNDKIFTFEASKYGLDEDVTEVTYDMWQNNYRLEPYHIRFFRTNAEGYEPFFNWRIGIQFHYTVDGVKNSSNIVYIEVFDAPNSEPGDVDNDGKVGISDVSALIDMILSGEITEYGDVDGDGKVSISDVSALIDLILTGGNN